MWLVGLDTAGALLALTRAGQVEAGAATVQPSGAAAQSQFGESLCGLAPYPAGLPAFDGRSGQTRTPTGMRTAPLACRSTKRRNELEGSRHRRSLSCQDEPERFNRAYYGTGGGNLKFWRGPFPVDSSRTMNAASRPGQRLRVHVPRDPGWRATPAFDEYAAAVFFIYTKKLEGFN